MALDDAVKHTYRRADSATLLGLLPELRRLSKRTQKELEQVESPLPLGSVDGVDVDPPLTSGHSSDPDFAGRLLSYSADVLARERWVRDELKRRGLIPLWPGEQGYLDEDA